VPFNDARVPVNGFGPRGSDIDRNGAALGSTRDGHMASFDRKKCKGPLNVRPSRTDGTVRKAGRSISFPDRSSRASTSPARRSRATTLGVDQFDTSARPQHSDGDGNMSDSIEALVDGKFVSLRVPYPMGFHAKGLDGRIDDVTMGWKGQRLVVDLCGPRAVPHRGRQRHDQARS